MQEIAQQLYAEMTIQQRETPLFLESRLLKIINTCAQAAHGELSFPLIVVADLSIGAGYALQRFGEVDQKSDFAGTFGVDDADCHRQIYGIEGGMLLLVPSRAGLA